MDKQLVAIYELKRQSFLLGFVSNPDHFDQALAYAYDKRVAPLFHEASAYEHYGFDPFEELYFVSRSFVDELTKYIDELERSRDYEALGFYQLEEKFGGYKVNRIELIFALEYTRISRRFSDETWTAISANAPAEAHNFDTAFLPKDVHF